MSAVDSLEREVNGHVNRGLGVPPSFTLIRLYGQSSVNPIISYGMFQGGQMQAGDDATRFVRSESP